MDILIKILQLLLCFTLIVGVHEAGHFIMARIFGIRVDKFYIFFDPWFSLFKFKRGDTEYGIGWLPLGGYCKIAGMIDESLDTEQMRQPAKPDEFRAKPAWQRLLVMLGGILMNLLLAVAIYTAVSYTWGERYFANEDARYGFVFNDAAKELGFVDGDRIVSVDGSEIDRVESIPMALVLAEGDKKVVVLRDGIQRTLDIPFDRLVEFRRSQRYADMLTLRIPFVVDSLIVPSALEAGDEVIALDGRKANDFNALTRLFAQHKGDSVRLDVVRGGTLRTLKVAVDGEGRIGVAVRMPDYRLRTREYGFWQSIPAGFRRSGKVLSNYWDQLRLIVKPQTKMYEEVGGFGALANIFPTAWDWQSFWNICAFISIILAIMNLLPIPGLDGGHALFTLWEIVTRRKPSDNFLTIAQYVGLLLIVALLLYANGNDIYRFLVK